MDIWRECCILGNLLMKTSLKVLGAVVALGCVILAIFHFTLLYGLTRMMRGTVLPRVKAETGIDAKVGRLSINVAAGMLYLDDLEIRNPDGFLLENLASVDRVEVAVDIKSLVFQKPLRVKHIEVENALVNVVRNREGDININQIGKPLQPPPSGPIPEKQPEIPPSEKRPPPTKPAPPPEEKPLPELLFDRIWCRAKVRYIDLKLNKLDIALDLDLKTEGLSTQPDPQTPWGTGHLTGALSDNKNSFVTDVDLRLAPLTDPAAPSFDLTGRILEIDPRLMEEIYDSLNVRSDPFGLEPEFHCRAGLFERSKIALVLRNIRLEQSLSKSLGGIGAIESLRFVVPVKGSLAEPEIDVAGALLAALGGNTRTLLGAWINNASPKVDAAVEALGEKIEEIGQSETTKRVLKDLADGKPSDTNAPPVISSDTIVDILGEQIEEIGNDEDVKKELKDLGKWLFGR